MPPRRKPGQREKDLNDLSEMLTKGVSPGDIFRTISERYNPPLSREAIRLDVKEVERQWMELRAENIDGAKALILAKLDRVEEQAWAAWARSLEDKERHEESSDDKGCGSKDVREGQSGNPAFLSVIESCIDKRCKILGIYAPTKTALTDPSGEHEYTGLTNEQLAQRALEIAAKLAGPNG